MNRIVKTLFCVIFLSCKLACANIQEKIGSEPKVVSQCNLNESCVRFCCVNETACASSSYFDLSALKQAAKLKETFWVLKGSPICDDQFYEADNINWAFNKVRNIKKKFC